MIPGYQGDGVVKDAACTGTSKNSASGGFAVTLPVINPFDVITKIYNNNISVNK